MATAPITSTNLANWIPDIWSKEVISDVEKNLVLGALCDRTYEIFAREGGDKIVVPNLFEITATATNTALDATLYDAVQNVTNIAIDQKFHTGVSVDDYNQIQSNPKYFEKVKTKLAYGLAKQVDINIGALFNALSTHKGAVHSALTEDVIISAYEALNLADVPVNDRAWVLDAESETDLLKLDYFVRMDYVPGSVVTNGFSGRKILGAPVYFTTNLDIIDVNAHAAIYMHREAFGLIIQLPIKMENARWWQRFSDVLTANILFGVAKMRDSFAVCINTRS